MTWLWIIRMPTREMIREGMRMTREKLVISRLRIVGLMATVTVDFKPEALDRGAESPPCDAGSVEAGVEFMGKWAGDFGNGLMIS
jgi:hypothetical protein